MSDYPGHLAQRASTTTPLVKPRGGAFFEPTTPELQVPTSYAQDEATERNAELAPPQPTMMGDRLQELQSTLSAATSAPFEISTDAGMVALQKSQPAQTSMTLAAQDPASQVRSANFRSAPHAALVRGESPGLITEHELAGSHASDERHPESNSRPPGVRPAVAAFDQPRAAQMPHTVRIEIGRIEIRATTPASRAPTSRPAARPRQSLEEYLQQRSRPTR